MDNTTDDQNQWRARAKDTRQIAKQLEDQIKRDILEDIAKSYERIADHVTRHMKDAGGRSR
jgi:hypothetical protein